MNEKSIGNLGNLINITYYVVWKENGRCLKFHAGKDFQLHKYQLK